MDEDMDYDTAVAEFEYQISAVIAVASKVLNAEEMAYALRNYALQLESEI